MTPETIARPRSSVSPLNRTFRFRHAGLHWPRQRSDPDAHTRRPLLRRVVIGLAVGCFSIGRAHAQLGSALPVTVSQNSSQVADGLIFLTPNPIGQLPAGTVPSTGPEIVDGQGRPVWFMPIPFGWIAADLRVQTYQGNPVLTWAEGPGFQNTVPGSNTDYICDLNYNVIATVQAGNGLNADEHEFQLTPEGTALITAYNNVPMDLSSVGGPADGIVQEGVAQEIDVATGAVLLEWHSLDHVALSESYAPVPTAPGSVYDYFHINSVKLDADGNILISSRHTWTVYKVNRTTGAVIWRLGGKLSDFTLGSGLPFAWQHDVEAVDSTTLRIFDNESNGTPVLPYSRVIWVTHDDTAMTASVIRSIDQPQGLSVPAEGDGQALANADTFVGWGVLGRFSEFDPNGNLLFDASLPSQYNCYRAYRFTWSGMPSTSPTATAQFGAGGTTTVHAVWNGATQVATWSVLGGASPAALSPVASAAWNGLDTAIAVAGSVDYVQVVALDASGNTLASSAVSAATPGITAQPQSQTIASGSTVVFSVAADGPQVTYQWLLNGSPLSDGASGGATLAGTASPTLVISGATQASAGNYSCTVSAPSGSTTSNPAALAVSAQQDVGRLVNVSARAQVGSGYGDLIAGFVVGGQQAAGSESLLIRASGPALSQFGISGVLPDPGLELSGTGISSPNSPDAFAWNSNPQIASAASAVGAFAWTDSPSLDQATIQTLPSGQYTAVVVSQSGDSGVALAEVYDDTAAGTYSPQTPHLINISARASVGADGNILIAGFVIGGETSKTVLIRASGPALAQFGVPGTLPDPELQLYGASVSTPLASNSGWGGGPALSAAASSAGAFAWTNPASNDSAILITLAPGAYTAQVSGKSGDTGVALVEVYEIQ